MVDGYRFIVRHKHPTMAIVDGIARSNVRE
jgi:hypothetical protein